MKKSNVYTRRGDDGTTGLVGGQRIPKSHTRLEAYGTMDELNSQVGLLLADVSETDISQQLLRIQNDLFSVGCELATVDRLPRHAVTADDVLWLENAIDQLDAQCGGWKGFILPGGSRGAALAHVCRTVCRRLERRIYAIDDGVPTDAILLQYINRLSDYFFLLAKKINILAGVEENIWQNRC
ncbi:MAG: cob(I)yrinic acid a,c-diamide adenosyltransferase [Bacteroidaceae bacterium]|nr:cob(I)yrinic acid a,c-diamide adenosyltransferase [Bacteroidaceae bacterium]